MPELAETSSWHADLALCGVTLIWGSTFIVNAKVIGRQPPVAYLALRFTIAALLLLVASARQRRTRSIAGDSILLGVLLALGMAFQIAGQTETTASKTAFITGLSVVLTPFFAIFRTRRGPGVANLLGVLLATAGFFLLSWPAGGRHVNRGDLMVLVCAVCFAIYIVENAERAPRHPTLRFTAFQLTAAAAALWVLSAWVRRGYPRLALAAYEGRPMVFDRGYVAAMSYMIVFATLITFCVTTWAQTKMSATHAAVIYALEPFWTAIFAAIVLSERLGAKGLAGGALVIAGIVVSELKFSRPESGPSRA
jgi:drug/metabolite transporter (DMT)-like permease